MAPVNPERPPLLVQVIVALHRLQHQPPVRPVSIGVGLHVLSLRHHLPPVPRDNTGVEVRALPRRLRHRLVPVLRDNIGTGLRV